jgi:hypothetical protein
LTMRFSASSTGIHRSAPSQAKSRRMIASLIAPSILPWGH